MQAPGPGSLLVIVPAYNEQGAVGEVVRELEQHVPGVPVLVIDDCSLDATVDVARAAAPTFFLCRTTSVWAVRCRPDISWPSSWVSNT